jgi:hypothetical protein
MKELKPLTIIASPQKRFQSKIFQQNILLKALTYTTDIKDLKRIARFHTDAEVYRTLDKLSIRKEYHEALGRNGLGLDTIVNGIKELCMTADKDDTKLKAYQFLLKSIGLDKYEVDETPGKNWEELLLKIDAEEQKKLTPSAGAIDGKVLYEVKIPEVPPDVLERRERDKEINESLYEGRGANKPG